MRVVRPTLRCLFEDLAREVRPTELRKTLSTASIDMVADPAYLLPCPLTDVEHLLLDKANLLATDDAAERERIRAIADRRAIKVKAGDRRAVLWQDEQSTWWLLAAGLRKDDGPGDFYRRLERFSKSSSAIAPTDADHDYHRLEAAYIAECQAERAAHGRVLAALLAAASTPGATIDTEVFGATTSIGIQPDENGLAVLEVSWELVQFDEQDRFPVDVLAMVPGRENIDLWDYLPPKKDSDAPHTWFTYVTQEWVDHLATSAELDDLMADERDWTATNPASDGSEHFSHLAKGSVVTLAYATGIEIIGLCGARVVAHRDYEKFPACPSCTRSLGLLRQLRDPE